MSESSIDNVSPSAERVPVGDAELSLIKGGSGKALLVLHGELGHPGWLEWHSGLARDRTLMIPLHPGFGRTPRVPWIASVRDLACFYACFLREQGLRPVDVIGFSFGGWIAAEMAANDPGLFRRMVLVAPLGLRPPEGEIKDMFVVPTAEYVEASVLDPATTSEFGSLYGGGLTPEQFEAWEDARAEVARLAWQPYMYNPSLEGLLKGVSNLPALLVWGREDAIVPLSAGQAYNAALSGSRLMVVEGSGHRPEIEKRPAFITAAKDFLG